MFSIQFCKLGPGFLARELATFDTRVPDAVVASSAGVAVALKDMPIGAVAVDRFVTAELPLISDAATVGGSAALLFKRIGV